VDKILQTGAVLKEWALVALEARNKNVQFLLPKGAVIPTFEGKCCDWHIVTFDPKALLPDMQKRHHIYHTMKGDALCVLAGKWEELGTNNSVVLSIGSVPPKLFANSILVNKD